MIELRARGIFRSALLKNSVWGILSSILQTVFVSAFFIILARVYAPELFAQFLVSTTVYQLIASFSSLGLGQWFIRQYASETDKVTLTGKFMKIQLILGVVFYGVNIGVAHLLYAPGLIRVLCVILGTNVVFDNFINAIRNLNIAEGRQKDTALVMIGDGLMKLLIGCSLFIAPYSLVLIATLSIMARLAVLGLFLRISRSDVFTFKSLWNASISFPDLKKLVLRNWHFIVIGSVSVIYWRIGNIIISKTLSLNDVADYEIAYRVFAILLMIPVIASATVFPRFVSYVNANDTAGLKKFYKLAFAGYAVFAVISYAFFYSFANALVPWIFGPNYPGAALCLQQMFLTFLVMPTVLLQANLIVALGFESKDMWFNIVSLLVYLAVCFIGLHFYPKLGVINYSIFMSFIVFHLLQDLLLVRKKAGDQRQCLLFYVLVPVAVTTYSYLLTYISPYALFPAFTSILLVLLIITIKKDGEKLITQSQGL